ncbi:MAG TPA: thioredoxin family protein [Terracidiphilus sp.]|jgi:thiol:disulfide interchange protein DsbD|nr:thioredoxin family protein [Terracidiphilus sp.]
MRFARLIFGLMILLLAGVPGFAASDSAIAPHVQVQLIHDEFGVFAPDEILAGLYFKLEPGWHVYWMNPGDAGQPPKIDWTLPRGVKAGPLQYPAPKRLPLGPLMDFGYEGEVAFPVALYVDSTFRPGSTVHVAAKVSWLVCRETCIPEKANLALDVPVVAGKPGGNGAVIPILQSAWAALPKPLPAGDKLGFVSTADGLRLTVETGQRETQAEFFPADQDVIDNPAPQKLTPTAKGFTLDLKNDASLAKAPVQLRGLIELSGGRAYEMVAPRGVPVAVTSSPEVAAPVSTANAAESASAANAPGSAVAPQPGLAKIVGLAFLGGILLNLMPCVFPVLFLKGLALVNSGRQERHKLRAHGLVYTLGIVVSFWALVGVLLALRAAGSRLGWGFQFQSPVFLFLMAGLLFFLGLSLAGQFEIGLPLTSAGGSLAAKHGYTGSFFTGVLAVIVATPCTAPFMGAAIGYALAAPAVATFAVFTALALGLAAPYLALTLQPAWTRILPRPGAWMEVLRQAVSVPIFGTVIYLAWGIANTYGAAMLAALLVGFLLLAIAGWFLGRWPAKGWSAVLAGLIVLCVVGLSVYSAQALAATPQMRAAAGHEGVWEPWSAETVARYQAQGRPVFVDFTASWCLSCQVNERVALTRPEVMQAFAGAHVALLKADWTQHDDAITDTLAKLGRSGVPVYALYTPGQPSPRLLPEALTPGIVINALAQLPRANAQLNASRAH